jgi:hypothetical protein
MAGVVGSEDEVSVAGDAEALAFGLVFEDGLDGVVDGGQGPVQVSSDVVGVASDGMVVENQCDELSASGGTGRAVGGFIVVVVRVDEGVGVEPGGSGEVEELPIGEPVECAQQPPVVESA